MVFLFPGVPVCVLAGATGMRPIVFVAWNFAGTLTAVIGLRMSPFAEWVLIEIVKVAADQALAVAA